MERILSVCPNLLCLFQRKLLLSRGFVIKFYRFGMYTVCVSFDLEIGL